MKTSDTLSPNNNLPHEIVIELKVLFIKPFFS
jgi:hypothetical protein